MLHPFYAVGSIRKYHINHFQRSKATMHTIRDISKEKGKYTDLVFFKNEIAIYSADEPGKLIIKDLKTDREKTVNESGIILLLSEVVN